MATGASNIIKAAKKELRSLMKVKLNELSVSSIEAQSDAALNALLNFNSYTNAKRVGIYLSMPRGEIQTERIVTHAIENGKEVFVPYLHKTSSGQVEGPSSIMDMVKLLDLADYKALGKDKWGIPSVDSKSIEGRERILGDADTLKVSHRNPLDLILMPGVAFSLDDSGDGVRRLGHGKGFYDYFLHRYSCTRSVPKAINVPRTAPRVELYGLALKEQLLKDSDPDIPVTDLDWSLHGLIVGTGDIVHSVSTNHIVGEDSSTSNIIGR